ncbi:right-handed parallel beta-helix repeat-containing protein [bacterium]|nr:right-handed parallel beta-helix repeat-containing protein [bacterium]
MLSRAVLATLLLLSIGGAAMAADAQSMALYVSPTGNDAWSGRYPTPRDGDGPLATLTGARDALRRLKAASAFPVGGISVAVQPGTYELSSPLELTDADSGLAGGDVIYRAWPERQVHLVGGKVVRNWTPVTDPTVLSRLDPSARGKVMQADLRAAGVTDLGEVVSEGRRLEFFFKDEPMTLSRWPNEGFVKIVDVLNLNPVDVRGTKGDRGGKFVYDGDRPKRWTTESDPWLHGYWFWDWADQRMKVESIDTDKRIISLAPPQHSYGYRKGQWYYALNLLCELDSPGEWYLDRQTGILYFWPPSPITDGSAVVSVLGDMVKLSNASNVIFEGFTFEGSRGSGIVMSGGEHNQVLGCTFRNLGSWAVKVSGGAANSVIGCDVYNVGNGGISLSGGDRNTITPAGHLAENNHIHHYGRWNRMYQPAISLSGVGNRAAHNLIHNAPHEAIAFSGNEHVIEYNEIHSVCYESNDAGAIYAGRNWTMRGTTIRYNYLHDISGFEGRGCVGVYLDDMYCGTAINNNLFYRVTRAAFIGGGRDNSIENNVFVDCRPAVHVDARAMGWAKPGAESWVKESSEKGTHLGLPYLKPPYSERYPQLLNIVSTDPFAPMGNRIDRNVCVGGRWDEIEGKGRPFLTIGDNLLDQDPLFVDAEHLNFQLKPQSPAYQIGFERLPIEKMGLYKDPRRASWPVTHSVRPAQIPPAPAPRAARTNPVVFRVPARTQAVKVDGTLNAEEWFGLDTTRGITVEQGINGEKLARKSQAWLAYDAQYLYLAIDNAVDPLQALRPGDTWGQDDAVEVSLQNSAAGKTAPILVLRGFPSGHFVGSDEPGTPKAVVDTAAQGVLYAARAVNAARWTAEWRIPWASLGIDPSTQTRFAFNLCVRKSAEPLWVEWQGTGTYTWEVSQAGVIELVR